MRYGATFLVKRYATIIGRGPIAGDARTVTVAHNAYTLREAFQWIAFERIAGRSQAWFWVERRGQPAWRKRR